jgi:hypothetical protein
LIKKFFVIGAIILHIGGTSAEDIIDTRIKLAVAEA